MAPILLVLTEEQVNTCKTSGKFEPQSLAHEGFIHACTIHQLDYVLTRFFSGQEHLFIALVDPRLVNAEVKMEGASTGESELDLFPHIYGALNFDAVVDLCPLALFQGTGLTQNELDLLSHYRFERLPVEGTLFKSTWRSDSDTHAGGPEGTAMIGMYSEALGSMSCFHKLEFDEIWHFYGGDPLELYLLYPDGQSETVIMGMDSLKGQLCQFRVPKGVWQGGAVISGGKYALFGCTMAPGFTGTCFTAADNDALKQAYPNMALQIEKLSVNGHETKMPDGFAT